MLYLPILFVFSYLLVVLKVYIILSYVPFFSLYLLLANVTLIRNKFAKVALVGSVMIGSVLGFVSITNAMQKALGNFASAGVTFPGAVLRIRATPTA